MLNRRDLLRGSVIVAAGGAAGLLADDAGPPEQPTDQTPVSVPPVAPLLSANPPANADSAVHRLEICKEHPSYFYDPGQARPIFLSGQLVWTSICTPQLWYSHSPEAFRERYTNKKDPLLDPDQVIDYLALKGGNCCRLTTFYGHHPPDKTPGPAYYPWSTVAGRGVPDGGKAQYDLLEFDDTYWQRFRHFLARTESKRIYVLLEVFPNLWQWENSPLHPDHNINYTQVDCAAKRDWYDTVRGGSPKVLAVQEAFVRNVVQESLPYRNVLYMINNQYLSEVADRLPADASRVDPEGYLAARETALAWPRYWAKWIKDIGKVNGESLLVSTMPHFHAAASPRAEQFRWYVDEALFDFIDTGWWRLHPTIPEYSLGETVWMEQFDDLSLRDRAKCLADSLRSWYDYLASQPKAKPLILSKTLFWDGVLRHRPWPLWIAFTSGYALASPHEPMSRSYWHAPRYEPAADVVGYLHRFIHESRINFWEMKPLAGIASGQGQDGYVLGNPGEEYVVYLVGEAEGPLKIELPDHEYIVEYYDPRVGQWIDTRLLAGGASSEVFIHEHYDELVLLIQERSKRETVMGRSFPQPADRPQ